MSADSKKHPTAKNSLSQRSFPTRAVHAGERTPVPDYIPVSTPIYPSVGYLYRSMDDVDAVFAGTKPGYVYSRYATPTVTAFAITISTSEATTVRCRSRRSRGHM